MQIFSVYAKSSGCLDRGSLCTVSRPDDLILAGAFSTPDTGGVARRVH